MKGNPTNIVGRGQIFREYHGGGEPKDQSSGVLSGSFALVTENQILNEIQLSQYTAR